MKFGLSEDQYEYIVRTVVLPLESEGAKVWCYGSRARGDFKPFSDLDLMVESNKDLTRLLANIQEQLSNSNFAYKVDLVQQSEFAQSYMAGYLRDRKIYHAKS